MRFVNVSPSGTTILGLATTDIGNQFPNTKVLVNQQVVAEVGGPSPLPGTSWTRFNGGVAVNDSGTWAIAGTLDSGEMIIVRDGEVIVRSTMVDDDRWPLGAEFLTCRGVTRSGRVIWELAARDPSMNLRLSLYMDSEPIVLGGTSKLMGGEVVTGTGLDSCALGPDMTHVGFRTTMLGAPSDVVAILLPLDQSLPQCDGVQTSAGIVPTFAIHGSNWVSDAVDPEIVFNALPPHAPLVVLASKTDAFLPGARGAIGDLCVGGQLTISSPMRASENGVVRTSVQAVLGSASSPTTGSTYFFQGWYRDRDVASPAVSRFTGSRSIQFR